MKSLRRISKKKSTTPPIMLLSYSVFIAVAVALVLLPVIRDAAAKNAPPQVTSLSQSAGPQSGGTKVTIHGNNLAGVTAVNFGSVVVKSFHYNILTGTITVTTPRVGSGPVHVTVTKPTGISSQGGAVVFTAVATPSVSSISPTGGSTGGGTTVTIHGSNLAGATAVDFGNNNPATIKSDSSTSITCTSPSGAAGLVNVSVTTGGGTVTKTGAFTYVAPPQVTSLSPAMGAIAGGTTVTISGSNLLGATALYFGNKQVTINTDSSSSITCTSPAGTGTVDVTVTTQYSLTSTKTPADLFQYVAPPTVTGLSLSEGSTAGGTPVTITGTNFTGTPITVDFGSNNPATNVTVVSSTSITCDSPPAGTGTVDVTVTTPYGTSRDVSADKFKYVPLPSVTGIKPESGSPNGNTKVTITGTNFIGQPITVDFGSNNLATNVIAVSATSITCDSPAGSGTVDVTVTTLYGTSATNGSDDQFTYATPAVAVYSDANYKVPWVAGNSSTTAYVQCTGLIPTSGSNPQYTLIYKDENGAQHYEDTGFPVSANGIYDVPAFSLTKYKSDTGMWTVYLYADGGSAYYTTVRAGIAPNCSPSPDCSNKLLDPAQFYVETVNIPEFPAWFTGILVMAACAGVYFWMRKRHQAQAA